MFTHFCNWTFPIASNPIFAIKDAIMYKCNALNVKTMYRIDAICCINNVHLMSGPNFFPHLKLVSELCPREFSDIPIRDDFGASMHRKQAESIHAAKPHRHKTLSQMSSKAN